VARSNNHHEAITNLAMPERMIPVLVASSHDRADGRVPSTSWALKGIGAPEVEVRRFRLPSGRDWNDPGRRRDLEKEFGAISRAQWNRLLSLIAQIEHVNAGDRRDVVDIDQDEEFARWYKEHFSRQQLIYSGSMLPGFIGRTDSTCMPSELALTAKFTAGLSRVRFVVWQDNLTKKFAPGLFCPDIMSAVYAAVLYGFGTPGGVGVCRKCALPFSRSRGPTQRYCSHKCQVAAAMKRYRDNLAEKSRSKSIAESKRRTKGK
jgi:hypothetical protein